MGIFSPPPSPCGMLQTMQQAAASTPSSTNPSFAGLLAALATPASPASDRSPAWNDSDLADDVATLSYEHALRAHARYKPPDPDSWLKSQSLGPMTGGVAANGRTPTPPAATNHHADWSADQETPTAHRLPTAALQSLKCTRVTIRVSEAEHAQLQQRAAEAGLTVSAYLRSCTFEAEVLRAEVKEALARFRAVPSTEMPSAQAPARRSWIGRVLRLLTPWRSGRNAART